MIILFKGDSKQKDLGLRIWMSLLELPPRCCSYRRANFQQSKDAYHRKAQQL